uniref:Translation initiation factor IF2/IF5 domain-containing protein n=1 Tax=Pinguiococcus pyrenoidosus TaxID=172671 RepID=A0A6U0TVU4_9STRA|mmetsp:Transcript_13928/g.51958  ORF Transcript_13928/g.51958 Transcript_13928/m.51958 type:complete len:221 (+) Transcript_13928:71-733(+)
MADVEEKTAADTSAEVAAMFDMSKKRKKKKKKKVAKEENGVGDAEVKGDGEEAQMAQSLEANYAYEDLLARALELVSANNPDHAERRQFRMMPPTLMKAGSKKTLWSNFPEIIRLIDRSSDHVFQFFLAELGTEGSIDLQGRLMLRGRFMSKSIESLLKRYVQEYVMCKMCRSPETALSRDPVSRLYFIHCRACGSSRSVAPIRSGYHAKTKADRRAARK